MADQPPSFLYRDGTSQADRALPALAADAALVDEREPADWLAFLQSYAASLKYYNLQNNADGDWTGFLGSVADPAKRAEIAAFLADPGGFPEARYDVWRRPHFALLLAFLGLLRSVRDQTNTFTRRHLDFYYRDLLGFRPRPAGSGSVHVLVEPASGQRPFLLPAGTLLDAGRDAQGGAVHYQTDADLLVTPAQVRQCRSLFLQRTLVGLDDVRRNPDVLLPFLARAPGWEHESSPSDKAFEALMEVALGEPNPGDPLPDYPYDPAQVAVADKLKALYGDLDGLLAFVRNVGGLALNLPAFRGLMALRHGLLPANPDTAAQWGQVNAALQKAGRKKRNDPGYTLAPLRADDFVTNLKTALNFSDAAYRTLYDTLPEVADVYGLSRHIQDDAVRQFVTGTLSFASVDDFTQMMAIVDGFYQQWQQILEILRGAGRRKQSQDPGHVVDPPDLRGPNPGNDLWERLLLHTIGNFNAQLPRVAGKATANLDDVDAAVQRLETSFFLSADDYTTVRAATRAGNATKPWEWDEVYAILRAARRAKETAKRRAYLLGARGTTTDAATGINKMAVAALGEIDPAQPAAGLQLPGYPKALLNLDPVADADYIEKELFLTPEEVSTLQKFSAATGAVDWDNVASILNEARGRKEKWEPPALEFESWDNVFAAPDATAVTTAAAGSPTPRWRTFGDGPREDGATVPASFGFMIASPLLALAEGVRTITLTLEFTKASALLQNAAVKAELAKATLPFRFLLSTAKGPLEVVAADTQITWTPGNAIAGTTSPAPNLRFVLLLGQEVPPIAPLSTGASTSATAPFLQVLPRDIPDPDHPGTPPKKHYDAFRLLVLAHVHLEVAVAGLTNVLMQNDLGALNPKTPFQPFGSLPVVGSRFLIAHPEICAKSLSKLEIGFDWLGLPPDLTAWYRGYSSPPANNQAFNAELKLSADRSLWDLKNVPLFPAAPATTVATTGAEIKAKYANYGLTLIGTVGDDPLDSDRYWMLELQSPDFFHSVYPQQAATAAVVATNKTILNPPYTPLARRLILNYSAAVDLLPPYNDPGDTDQIFYLEPFGYRPIKIDPKTPPEDVGPDVGSWLPQYDLEGQLFIGIDPLSPPQTLPLLFQLAAGSADPDVTPEPVRWSYLSGNEWLELDNGRLLADATRGLANAGIVELDLPAVEPSTLLPPGLYWLRLAMARHSRGVCDVMEIRTQAVTASLAPDSAGASGRPLAPNTIKALAQPRPQVKGIQQPYSPFADNPPEGEPQFATRVSERLRHKGRALTCWDYERLVLEAFPEIHKAKCLAVDSADDPRRPTVRVVVIPDIRGKLPFDPFEPKVPADVLSRVETFLADRCAAGAAFRVQNPQYCSLKLRFSVRLRPGCNPGFYLPQLNDEVCRFLSPWAYDDSADIVFGNRASANLIVYFLEQRPYVDYVTDLKLFLSMAGQPPKNVSDQMIDLVGVTGGAPDVILVSERTHQIDLITGEQYVKTSYVGVDYMKVELDFSVA